MVAVACRSPPRSFSPPDLWPPIPVPGKLNRTTTLSVAAASFCAGPIQVGRGDSSGPLTKTTRGQGAAFWHVVGTRTLPFTVELPPRYCTEIDRSSLATAGPVAPEDPCKLQPVWVSEPASTVVGCAAGASSLPQPAVVPSAAVRPREAKAVRRRPRFDVAWLAKSGRIGDSSRPCMGGSRRHPSESWPRGERMARITEAPKAIARDRATSAARSSADRLPAGGAIVAA